MSEQPHLFAAAAGPLVYDNFPPRWTQALSQVNLSFLPEGASCQVFGHSNKKRTNIDIMGSGSPQKAQGEITLPYSSGH